MYAVRPCPSCSTHAEPFKVVARVPDPGLIRDVPTLDRVCEAVMLSVNWWSV